MASEPRILHFHDCADVGGALVRAAKRHGLHWDYLSAEAVRPSNRPNNPLVSKGFTAKLLLRNRRAIAKADIVHIHYAMVVPNAQNKFMPERPYFLHLHGTDIRKHWANGRRKSKVQPWIEGAERVYYTNLDTRENAEEAFPGAEFMPAFIEPDRLVPWAYTDQQPQKIVFLSRWEDIKGAPANIALARELRRAFPGVALEGLDWGDQTEQARQAGVNLVPKMGHSDYVRWISEATIAIGQAQPMLGVSEFEAMAIGLPVAVLGSRIPRPTDGATPPVIEGDLDAVVEGIRLALDDPFSATEELGAKQWVLDRHLADSYVPGLQRAYRETLGLDPSGV
ncbi:glycosyltransferase family protein [Trueperella bialowiezensis]|uniref:Sugar transferase, PEP-CTERM/EpsH1 system associated n=1 Tax=Trueperella bialowiezensis TaxID=312285 RepID=A0A448PDB6_9ACTO|nr:glycosyltransferase family 4 protein [Trueperella bialowiezensis]VEI12922.1 Uncharacterised protein [Trueperella bialowiezensis]